MPGPLTVDQAAVTGRPLGSPSSVTDPLSVAEFGSVTALSAPAFTAGGWLTRAGAATVTVTSSALDSAPSLPVSRST